MACTRQGQMEEAEDVLKIMLEANLAPDIRALNMLIKGYSGAGDLVSMERVTGRLFELEVKPSCSTYNTLIDAYASRGMMQKVCDSQTLLRVIQLFFHRFSYDQSC